MSTKTVIFAVVFVFCTYVPTGGCATIGEKPYIVGTKTYPIPKLPLPKHGETLLDPNFGTKITRITDAADNGGKSSNHGYPTFSSLNADSSRTAVTSRLIWYIYDSKTCKKGAKAPGVWHDVRPPRWDTYDPDIYYFCEGTALKKHNVKTGQTGVIHDFKKDFPQMGWIYTSTYCDTSFDRRYWGFSVMAPKAGVRGKRLAVITYDMKEDKILGKMADGKGAGVAHPNIAPSGRLVLWSKTAYDLDFTNPRKVDWRYTHSDMGVDINGHDVLLVVDNTGSDNNEMIDLVSGKRTRVLSTIHGYTWKIIGERKFGGRGQHISGNCYATPGWAVVSRYGPRGKNDAWCSHAIYLVKLDPDTDIKNPTVWRVADSHSVNRGGKVKDYGTETQASIDYSGRYIFFRSTWDNDNLSTAAEVYRVELPEGWYEKLMGKEAARRSRELTAKNFGVSVDVLLRKKKP